MKTGYSSGWKASKKSSKQRKYAANAPAHLKSGMIRSMLSEELKKKHSKNAVRVIKGDKVQIMRGQFRGKTGKVEEVSIKDGKVSVEKIELEKKDGTKSLYPIHHSNVMVTELNLTDKKRIEALKRK